MTHRTKNMLLLLPLCAVLLLTGFTSSFEKSYQDAEALLAQGDYEAASAKFRELGRCCATMKAARRKPKGGSP